MKIETDIAMPGTEPAKPEPVYERFICLNGDMEGRGLIVPMPTDHVAGYDLMMLRDGTRVAIRKEPMAAQGLTPENTARTKGASKPKRPVDKKPFDN